MNLQLGFNLYCDQAAWGLVLEELAFLSFLPPYSVELSHSDLCLIPSGSDGVEHYLLDPGVPNPVMYLCGEIPRWTHS